MSEQNKIPCAVAQDLMPLVIDGAALCISRYIWLQAEQAATCCATA